MGTVATVMTIIAGLALFLYGMKLLGDSLEKVAGDKFRHILAVLTKNRFISLLVGCLFTMIIQSSSATSVMVVGFVNAGLLNLTQAIGIIMGANIGTTITSFIIALNIIDYAAVLLLIGVVIVLFIKHPTWQKVGMVTLSLGVLFIGLNLLSTGIAPLKNSPEVHNALTFFSNPFLALLMGVAVTSVISSSSASVGILQVMAGQGLVPIQTSIFIILGCHIGTCVNALLACMGGKKEAVRTALAHLFFNVIGAIVLFCIFTFFPVATFVEHHIQDPKMQVALVHIFSQVFTAIMLFPFAPQLAKLTRLIARGEDPKPLEQKLMYIDNTVYLIPSAAVVQIKNEIMRMGQIAIENFKRGWGSFLHKDEDLPEQIAQHESVVNYLNNEITACLIKANQLKLPAKDAKFLGACFHVVNDIERIGNHAENLYKNAAFLTKTNTSISDVALDEIAGMMDKVLDVLGLAMEVFETGDYNILHELELQKKEMNALEKKLQQFHVDRLNKELCNPRAGMIFSDIVSSLERVSDHAIHIAFSVLPQYSTDEKD